MRFEVTQKDIHDGTPKNAACCPVALAMSRCTGEVWRVGPYVAELRDGRGRFTGDVLLPAQVTDFVYQFDAGKPVSPFAFEVHIP